MKNFVYFHCYGEDLWRGYEKNGLLRENFGIRCMQSIYLSEDRLFNSILKKGGELYNYIKEKKCFLYVDRLQGGTVIQEYEYDEELIREYREMLGDRFLGFQMHEWLTNYKNDVDLKLAELSEEQWTEENIKRMIFEKYPYPYLFLEAMTAKEHAEAGKPKSWQQFYDNMTAIYRKRAEKFPLLPCSSWFMMFPFEAENGATAIMPEIGAQARHMRLQMCFARGVCKAYGIRLGAYYEPWGGIPFGACSYNNVPQNEWGVERSEGSLAGKGSENYGSSRSLQWRAHLYAYLSGAEFISEEWGGYNTFKDMETYELSEYGLVKKRFLDFVDKYPDVGEKVSPIAAVISNRLPCFTVEGYATGGDDTMFGYPMDEELMAINKAAKDGARRIFQDRVDMLGTEPKVLINSYIPDAVDMLNEGDGHALKAYQYLVDITGEADFKDRYDNVITPDEVEEKLHELLPCRVDGGFHYLLNEAEDGYYLSVFNHSGIVRTVETGDSVLPEATKTAIITLKDDKTLLPLEGNTDVRLENGKYFVELKGGEWLFAKIL
jgi:hypothetical protein